MNINPVHVGGFFKRRYIDENDNLNVSNAADCLGVSRQHLHKLIKGEAVCTTDMCARLAKATDTNLYFWMNMNASYEIRRAESLLDDLDVKLLSAIS